MAERPCKARTWSRRMGWVGGGLYFIAWICGARDYDTLGAVFLISGITLWAVAIELGGWAKEQSDG